MHLTLNDLTVGFDHLDPRHLLDDWRWLIGPTNQPILVSAVGDAFVQDENDRTVRRLDTAAGTCNMVAVDEDEFRQFLADPNWVTDHLAVRVIADFLSHGLRLADGQVYSWKRPPALGGEYEFENAEASDIVVHFSLTGQIHRQVQSLPQGTPVNQIRFRDRCD